MRNHFRRPAGWATILLLWILPGTHLAAAQPEAEPDEGWVQLFNGRDLTGWDTFLSRPFGTDEAIGLNRDPYGVYTVQDGAIRISGEVWGALTSHDAYENYHLRVEFRWGEKKWPPREQSKRDSGILYHAVGPHGAQAGNWMRSHEMQIQEGDSGDYHSLDGALIDIEAERGLYDGGQHLKHAPGAPVVVGVHERVLKAVDHEKPSGAWNVAEVILDGDTITHIMNGHVVLRASNSRHVVDGEEVPLTGGRIQIQSEGAEVFYRKIEVRPLPPQ